MFKAIIYKEWIKTRKAVLLATITFAGFIIYTFINTAQMFRNGGAVQTWATVIMNDIPLIPYFQWLPLLAGMLVAVTQFVPEMVNKRLKLTLHLPMKEVTTMVYMLLYGIIVLICLYIVTYIVLLFILSTYFPAQILAANVYCSLPWFIGGIAGYLLVSWIIIEPIWRQRIMNAVFAILALSVLFTKAPSGAFLPMLPMIMVSLVLSFSFPVYSMTRFKTGVQS